jgi:hypothetical protein
MNGCQTSSIEYPILSFLISHSVVPHVLKPVYHVFLQKSLQFVSVAHMHGVNDSHIKKLNLVFSAVNCIICIDCACVQGLYCMFTL